MKNTLLYIFIFTTYIFANVAEIRIKNTIPETAFDILIDNELVLEDVRISQRGVKQIMVPLESTVSILSKRDLIYKKKLSLTDKSIYEMLITKPNNQNSKSKIALLTIHLGNSNPRSTFPEAELDAVESLQNSTRSGKYVSNDETRGMREVN